ncbi:asparagine synthase (glutamine-hydrolyzing) [Pontibacter roseus]|uniref:asparagine synthase (glutamine-hydrolyzing) n=1 Tax=Pontibacter roseus TaxID=336989 RepID=UPI00037DE5ED|nr:asparagine synthase (glutamine-hydrolyzing) [Pontibacter roseus]
MCGIVGAFVKNGIEPTVSKLHLIRHRGPDGEGEWVNEKRQVYLGHTRLAILEPTPAGQQPMQDSSKRYTITFNGEIYNHLELRALLPDISWRGMSDTETLVELLASKGLEALPLLKGMFAFAMYDSQEDDLLLVRDRLGIKPLWFKREENEFWFASEASPLLEPDATLLTTMALSEYISYGRLPSSGEILEGVHALPPASWLKVSGDGKVQQGKWWPGHKFAHRPLHSRDAAISRVNELVTKAIQEHLISDLGVGTFLSGGMDSSIIALVAGKELGKNLRTFTVGFPQSTHDERHIARRVAESAGTDHSEIEVDESACLDWIVEAVANFDLPSVDAINTYIVSKAVRKAGLKVALSGLGGDELFGGYPSFRDVPMLRHLNALPAGLRAQLLSVLPQPVREKLEGLDAYSVLNLAVNRRRFASIESLVSSGMEDGTPCIPCPPDGLDTMGLVSWAELQCYTIPMLLRDSDQMSMAVGLEIRVPFLDHSLVEEVLSMPQKYKRGKTIKPLLVDAFKNQLPAEVYNRPKQGFALPMDVWMRGPLKEFTKEGIAAASDFIRVPTPSEHLRNFGKGLVHWTRVWQWCVLGHWLAARKQKEGACLIEA